MKRKLLALVAFLAMAAVAVVAYSGFNALTDGTASAQRGSLVGIKVNFSYAVKWLCGSPPGTVAADDYETKINVHNPQGKPVTFAKKVIYLSPGQNPTAPGVRLADTLNPDFALEMKCSDIFALGANPTDEGFVIIESPKELDVVAVYTSVRKDERTVGEPDFIIVGCLTEPDLANINVVTAQPIAPGSDMSGGSTFICPSGTTSIGVGAKGTGVGLTLDVEQVEPTEVSKSVIANPE